MNKVRNHADLEVQIEHFIAYCKSVTSEVIPLRWSSLSESRPWLDKVGQTTAETFCD